MSEKTKLEVWTLLVIFYRSKQAERVSGNSEGSRGEDGGEEAR